MASETENARSRTYRKRVRAEQEEATRERITEAAVRLHGSIGPARTTVSGVAQEAGVQRATVYRHFPDEASLFAACSAHYWSSHPLPDVESWKAIRDHGERLRKGLAEFYAFYEQNEAMLEKTGQDSHLVPAMAGPRAAFFAFLDHAKSILMTGRSERGAARKRTAAALGHALLFPTWQSLRRLQGLSNAEAVAVVVAMVEGAGSSRPPRLPHA
jgi:AcrR family transcriptional regulator